jgi:hypothetical protein
MRPCAQCIVDSQRGGVVLQVSLVPVPAVPVSVVAARICAAVRVTSPYSYSLTVNPFEVSALVMAKENPFELAKASRLAFPRSELCRIAFKIACTYRCPICGQGIQILDDHVTF